MLFPTLRDTGDEILKGWLFMAWLLMDTTDAISWAPSEENILHSGLQHCGVAGKEGEARASRTHRKAGGSAPHPLTVPSATGFSGLGHAPSQLLPELLCQLETLSCLALDIQIS